MFFCIYIYKRGVLFNMKMKNNLSKINEFLEIPKEVVTDIPRFTMIGNEELLIENCKGILEYEDFFVRAKTSIRKYKYQWVQFKSRKSYRR